MLADYSHLRRVIFNTDRRCIKSGLFSFEEGGREIKLEKNVMWSGYKRAPAMSMLEFCFCFSLLLVVERKQQKALEERNKLLSPQVVHTHREPSEWKPSFQISTWQKLCQHKYKHKHTSPHIHTHQ